MPIAVNDKGDALFLTPEAEWKPTKIAMNPQTNERLAFDEQQRHGKNITVKRALTKHSLLE
jgi:hypothetical protein